MLQRLITLDNVGLFRNGIPKALDLGRTTLIYAENGRGKTTLCAVLRSCAENQPGAVTVRKTADADDPPSVALRLDTGGVNVAFEKGVWSSPLPQVMVFDSEFVERNVYAGQEVRTSHKQQLLDFALGDAAVKLKAQTDELAAAQLAATRERTAQENKLEGYRGQASLADFLALQQVPDVADHIVKLDVRLRNATAAKEIAARRDLTELSSPIITVGAFEALLQTSIEGVQADAEKTVRQHLATHPQQGLEQWVAEGQQFVDDKATCPFCAQSLKGVGLLTAYKAYFSAEYNNLKARVTRMKTALDSGLSPRVGEAILQSCATNDERYAQWREHVNVPLPALDAEQLITELAAAAAAFGSLVDRKVSAPLEKIGTDAELRQARAALAAVTSRISQYNAAVVLVNKQIAEFKTKLAGEDVNALQKQLAGVWLQEVRYRPEVVAIVAAYRDADGKRSAIEQQKEAVRAELAALMAQTLTDYGIQINVWLKKFGASFSVEQLKQVYAPSGAATTDYGIQIRGKVVKPGQKSDSVLSFSTALSEGDKRTLAFAFFLARLFGRPDRANLIAVLDDPFASLDRHRRAQTQAAIVRAAQECKQVIVLAHDAFFLRDVRADVVRKGLGSPCVLGINHAAHGYSCIEPVDLSTICISPYVRNYRRVLEFLAATGRVDSRTAAEALRPLVEGHLHRRFPGMLNGEQTLGKVIESIRSAPKASPLAKIQDQAPALDDFNTFAGRYHHDTNPNAEGEAVSDAEVRTYGAQAVALIQTGRIP